jgi:hypothetical protein
MIATKDHWLATTQSIRDKAEQPFFTQFFDALKKLVVVVGVVMRKGQGLHAGHFLRS